jgi:hypothetical protein
LIPDDLDADDLASLEVAPFLYVPFTSLNTHGESISYLIKYVVRETMTLTCRFNA